MDSCLETLASNLTQEQEVVTNDALREIIQIALNINEGTIIYRIK